MSTSKRKCIVCKVEKPATEKFFYKDKSRYLGLGYRCKECDSKRKDCRMKRWEKMTREEKDKRLAVAKVYRKTVKGKAISAIKAYMNSDRKKGYNSDIDQEFFISEVLKPCHYCGFPATGLDRIDNSKGHTKDNCVPCCKECNVARMNNFSHTEMLTLGRTIAEIKHSRISNQ